MKTIVGMFDVYAQAEAAAQSLTNMGIGRDDISLLASNETQQYGTNPVDHTGRHTMGEAAVMDAEAGAGIGAVLGLLAGASLFVVPGLGWIAGAGWLAGIIGGAATGAVVGGLVGVLTHVGVPAEDAAYYHEGVRRGGTLVAVRADDSQAVSVAQTLRNMGAVDIEQRAAQYRSEGFTPASVTSPGNGIPGIQTGGRDIDGTPDTRGITEKAADALTGDRYDDKTGKPVA